MRLLKDPKTPLWIRIVSWTVALLVALLITRLVFTFGYYASGLAVLDEYDRRMEKIPIKLEFQDPGDPPAGDPNAAPDPNASGDPNDG